MKYKVLSFDSNRKNAAPYIVEAHDEGKRWTCTCPHFQFRLSKSGTHCKHIDKVIADNKRNEKIQADIAAQFEKGYGFDLDDAPKPDETDSDIKVAPAM